MVGSAKLNCGASVLRWACSSPRLVQSITHHFCLSLFANTPCMVSIRMEPYIDPLKPPQCRITCINMPYARNVWVQNDNGHAQQNHEYMVYAPELSSPTGRSKVPLMFLSASQHARRPVRMLQARDEQLRCHGHFTAEVLPRRVGLLALRICFPFVFWAVVQALSVVLWGDRRSTSKVPAAAATGGGGGVGAGVGGGGGGGQAWV